MQNRHAGVLFLLLYCLGVTTVVAAPAVNDYERSLNLRDQWMYLTRDIAEPARWADEQHFYYRRTTAGGFEFMLRHVEDGEARPAFDHQKLADALADATGREQQALRLPFSSFSFRDDRRAVRFRAHGDELRCDIEDEYACQTVTRDGPESRPRAFGVVRDLSVPADNTPRPSPDGRYEAFVRDHNVMLRSTEDGEVRQLSQDGTEGHFYDPESLVWSPDSSRLAIYRVRPGYPRQVKRVETAPGDQLQPRLQSQLYPKPGDPVDIESPVIFQVDESRQLNVSTDLFANPFRMSAMQFRDDGKSLAFRFVERGHQRVRLIEVDTESGEARVVIDETSETFVNDWWHRGFFHDVKQLGREILWMSERDGWNHLYLYDGKTGRARQLTEGEWVVRRVLEVDEQRREIWFAASGREPGDPYFQHVYRIDFDGRNLRHMTPHDAWHDVSLSPDLDYYVNTWSRVDHPTVSELRDARSGELLATLEEGDVETLKEAGFRYPEPFVAPGRDGETPIHGLIVRPTDYDPEQRYPVIENIYAGPHDSFVPKTFWPFGRHAAGDKVIGMQALADLGFIVVQIDGMGTMNRSKAFHDVAWKNLGDSGFPDRIAWHRALAEADPSYDIERGVGIYGASAGGQSALGALLFHSDFYTVAVAYNGCYDNRMDKISWNEQWMGWPVDESYSQSSGVDQAHRLQGRLLLILGEQDSNVDPASTWQVVDALIQANKDFDLLALPGEGHGVGRSNGPIDYVNRRKFDFFVTHLLEQSTPEWNRQTTP
ncbi:DPP IV N-terminal domain-containing protein [Wenzhouxiangella sp. AB-CW3]|nr:DPP IV N-terminal domain-containing protein [Wenzhouxiangella sp. AB-CW3]